MIRNSQNILMLNDRIIYNFRYRAPLISLLCDKGHNVEGIGVYDRGALLPLLALRLLIGRHDLVLCSNLKSNVFALLFSRRPKVIILNGFGRFRGNARIRAIVRFLLGFWKNTFAIVQNYADYRYLRRYCPHVQMEWLPGSGGVVKTTGHARTVVTVQRDDKISAVAGNIIALLSQMQPCPKLAVVGCENRKQLDQLFAGIPFRASGYVDASDIFREGGTFLQPMGYGEGFPHTLADAIVSGMDVYISDIEFLRYGLSRLSAHRTTLAPGWSRLISSAELISAVHATTIAARTVQICETFYQDSKMISLNDNSGSAG